MTKTKDGASRTGTDPQILISELFDLGKVEDWGKNCEQIAKTLKCTYFKNQGI